VLFGTPVPVRSQANLGVLKNDQVNIIVHGHEPVLSEMIVAAASEPDMISLSHKKGATGINVAGICCSGNEVCMRHGIPTLESHCPHCPPIYYCIFQQDNDKKKTKSAIKQKRKLK